MGTYEGNIKYAENTKDSGISVEILQIISNRSNYTFGFFNQILGKNKKNIYQQEIAKLD